MVAMDFVALDVETANADLASVCAVGLVHFRDGQVFRELELLIDPQDHFDPMNIAIHGITPDRVVGKPTMKEAIPAIGSNLADCVIVHHSLFDRTAFHKAAERFGVETPDVVWLDSLRIARRAWLHYKDVGGYGLANLCQALNIVFRHHEAAEDARAAGLIVLRAIAETGIPLEQWPERCDRPLHWTSGDDARPVRQGNLAFLWCDGSMDMKSVPLLTTESAAISGVSLGRVPVQPGPKTGERARRVLLHQLEFLFDEFGRIGRRHHAAGVVVEGWVCVIFVITGFQRAGVPGDDVRCSTTLHTFPVAVVERKGRQVWIVLSESSSRTESSGCSPLLRSDRIETAHKVRTCYGVCSKIIEPARVFRKYPIDFGLDIVVHNLLFIHRTTSRLQRRCA
jgi:DNA polymerase III epsilon subunit-like protein